MSSGSEKTLSYGNAKKLLMMLNGQSMPASLISPLLVKIMEQEGVVYRNTHGSRSTLRLVSPEKLTQFLYDQYGITDKLEDLVSELTPLKSRPAYAARSNYAGGAYGMRVSTQANGFLVSSYSPLKGAIGRKSLNLKTVPGTSIFISDFESFSIPEDVIVVGVERGDDFLKPDKIMKIFGEKPVLLVHRFPGTELLIKWLHSIPNKFYFYGRMDLESVNTFIRFFYCELGERAEFFIPEDARERLRNGNMMLFKSQLQNFRSQCVTDKRLISLVAMMQEFGRVEDRQ